MKKIIGYLMIIIGICCPILSYICYCQLMEAYDCSESGASISCYLTGVVGTILFILGGFHNVHKIFD